MKTVHKTFILAAALGLIFTGCQRPEPPFRIGTNIWPGYEPLYLARGLGYFDNTPIKMAEYLSATDVMNSFRNDSIEAAALTLDETFLLLQEGFDLKIILVLDYSNGADAVIANSSIKDLAGLKGKRIAVESMAVGAYVLSRALEKGGLTPLDVTVVQMPVDEHEKAFKSGKVDAVVTFEPVITKLMGAGGNRIFDSGMIPGEVLDVLVVRGDMLKERPGAVRQITAAWSRALDYIVKQPGDASMRMAVRSRISGAEFTESLKGVHLLDIKENLSLLADRKKTGILVPAGRLSKMMVENRLIKKEIDILSVITPLALWGGG